MRLPEKGPWPHPWFETPGETLDVSFADAEGRARTVRTYHKVLGSGPPLVLVHGLMTTSYSFRYVLEPLARRYRLFVPDVVGAGQTDKPLDLVYSLANVGRFVASYVRAVSKEPVYLVGNSLGGLHCVRGLLDHPGLARKFVLMHSPGYPFFRAKLLNWALRGFHGRALGALTARAMRRFRGLFVPRAVHYARADMLSQEEVREYGKLFETLDGARAFVRILRESMDPREHARTIADLRALGAASKPFACPTLVLYARKDVMVPPAFGPLYARDIPGCELAWMDGNVSHFCHVDDPARTVAVVEEFDAQGRGQAPPLRTA